MRNKNANKKGLQYITNMIQKFECKTWKDEAKP